MVVVPVTRLKPAFLQLTERLAGEFIQNLQNCLLRLADVGDTSALAANSTPPSDFLRESDRHCQPVCAKDLAALAMLLHPP